MVKKFVNIVYIRGGVFYTIAGGFMDDNIKIKYELLLWLACLIQVILMLAIFFIASSVFNSLPWGSGPGDQVIPAVFGLPLTSVCGIFIAFLNIKSKALNLMTVVAQFAIFGLYLVVCYIASFYTYFSIYYYTYTICGSIALSIILIIIDFIRYIFTKRRRCILHKI